MKIKKLCNQQYEILSKDNDIYITRHKNPGTDIYIYFISIWEFDLNGQLIEDECFDELDETGDDAAFYFEQLVDYFRNHYRPSKGLESAGKVLGL